jgi:hypothetical protein
MIYYTYQFVTLWFVPISKINDISFIFSIILVLQYCNITNNISREASNDKSYFIFSGVQPTHPHDVTKKHGL